MERCWLDNTALVSHQNCMDGSTCAIVFLAAGGRRENVYFTQPSHENSDEIVNYLADTHTGPILVADMSISLGLAEKLDQRGARVILLDHHKTAIPLDKFEWCEIEVENKRAGGKMLYDFLKQEVQKNRGATWTALERLVDAADDYDRWIRQDPKSEDLVTFHDAVEQEAFIERFKKDPVMDFSEKERYVIDIYKTKREHYVQRKKNDAAFFSRQIQGHNVKIGLVEAGTNQSILGNAICSDPELDCDIAIMCNGRSVSFRASATCPVDLSILADLNGGGGHKKSSGVPLGELLGENFAELVYQKMRWE